MSQVALGYPFLELLPIAGVAVCVFDRSGQPTTLLASDDTAARLDELQFDLGEGPIFSVFATGQPTVIRDLSNAVPPEWLFFQRAAVATGAAALTVLPLLIGAACVGTVSLHWMSPNELNADDLQVALAAARSIAAPTVHTGNRTAQDRTSGSATESTVLRSDVHQAVGMVLAQLDITATEAFARMRAYAFANDLTLHNVAANVVKRNLDFRTFH
jgi:transcriptional regulator with GAF, ATPase, and Fis domain